MTILIPVKNIKKHCNPFTTDIWGTKVSRSDVTKALKQRNLISDFNSNDHPARIAYLVENESSEAITVDVGVPALGYIPEWIVIDGNHRIAAAIYAKRPFILAEVAGQVDYAQQLLGVDITQDS